MKPWFDTQDRIEALQRTAKAWNGTPFMPNACVRGAGVSCQKLASGIYVDVGFFPVGKTVPDGPMDWGQAHKRSLIDEFLSTDAFMVNSFMVVEGGAFSLQTGDMVGFKIGGCIHHLGIVVDTSAKRFVHCWRAQGVELRRYDDPVFSQRIGKIWRPVEHEL